ncbi:MAG: sigma 54-interacting transcriptional regulator [Deltaproteobacteria bacterium]
MAKRKKKTNDLNSWLASVTTPVFVIDSERRICAFNAGCQSLTGWGAGDVVGEACHYGSIPEIAGAAALAASLCPPPEVFAGEEASAPANLIHQQGHALPRMLHFFPLRDEKERLNGVLGIVSPLPPAGGGTDATPARQLHAELAALRISLRARFASNTPVSRSMAMRRVLAQVELAMNSRACVLLSGGPGTGKEHLARVIHFGGPDRGNFFIPLDCRRLGPDELSRVWNRILDSYQTERSPRSPASPQPGTVFLADVEYLPRDLQEQLVRIFSQTGPLRLLASTCLATPEMASGDRIRPDFYALVSPLAIELPPLSQRLDDLPLLAQHFLEELNRQEPKQLGGFEEPVWPLLARYDWPGNLDELAAVVREAHVHAARTLIRPDDLPYRFRTALAAQELPPPPEPPPMLLDPLLTKVETQLITLALERSRNNKSRAAELLGINRARLLRRIEQLHIGAAGPEPGDAAEEPGVSDEKTEP